MHRPHWLATMTAMTLGGREVGRDEVTLGGEVRSVCHDFLDSMHAARSRMSRIPLEAHETHLLITAHGLCVAGCHTNVDQVENWP